MSIKRNKRYYSDDGTLRMRMTGAAVLDISMGGRDAEPSVRKWLPTLRPTMMAWDGACWRADAPAIHAAARRVLFGYGSWDDKELSDKAANLRRVVWLAACDIETEEKEKERQNYDYQ